MPADAPHRGDAASEREPKNKGTRSMKLRDRPFEGEDPQPDLSRWHQPIPWDRSRIAQRKWPADTAALREVPSNLLASERHAPYNRAEEKDPYFYGFDLYAEAGKAIKKIFINFHGVNDVIGGKRETTKRAFRHCIPSLMTRDEGWAVVTCDNIESIDQLDGTTLPQILALFESIQIINADLGYTGEIEIALGGQSAGMFTAAKLAEFILKARSDEEPLAKQDTILGIEQRVARKMVIKGMAAFDVPIDEDDLSALFKFAFEVGMRDGANWLRSVRDRMYPAKRGQPFETLNLRYAEQTFKWFTTYKARFPEIFQNIMRYDQKNVRNHKEHIAWHYFDPDVRMPLDNVFNQFLYVETTAIDKLRALLAPFGVSLTQNSIHTDHGIQRSSGPDMPDVLNTILTNFGMLTPDTTAPVT
ncbi:hypothetical protein AUK40_00465 [Candidatus Wirthbacteria bacterium CG2_30_54_11]|uniref:Uncharacterized protein n=1 Tax=Candidatus Wirthbacteria bacterium CG2_30_54_11 TaxID=1817892 RepID=A0A1J5ISN0_9BACT|nr:MAG: hypothetical protein AUK40_00465 [Candidatus Wirthbacteria bacterium CG2_30_54_11]